MIVYFLTLSSIVAVHGLGGHPFRTWTHKNQCCWPRDLLSVDIPDARIMTFGYDANVIGSSINTFKDSAQLLLQHLLLKRDPELVCVSSMNMLKKNLVLSFNPKIPSSRPILFICHSLGGLVTKQVCTPSMMSCALILTSLGSSQSIFNPGIQGDSCIYHRNNIYGNTASRIFRHFPGKSNCQCCQVVFHQHFHVAFE